MEMIFHSHANKTHFHKKGCALRLILKVRIFGTWKWLILNFLCLLALILELLGLGDKAVYILILTLTSTDACIKCKKG